MGCVPYPRACGSRPMLQVPWLRHQLVWNLFRHHHLNADIPPRGIERIAYVNADQRAESLTLISSFSCICGVVNHSLDSVHSESDFPKSELVLRETILPDHESLKPL